MNKLQIIVVAVFALMTLGIFSVQAEKLKVDISIPMLSIGQKAQDFTLPNAYGEDITLYNELKKGPVILSFYRGSWCPVCNRQLLGFQSSLEEFSKLGAQLIAVSPERPSLTELMLAKEKLTFEALSDHNNVVAREYGILWSVPEESRGKFLGWLKEEKNKSLEEFNGVKGFTLPIPATFVIAKDAKVVYAFGDEDYSKRADVQDILAALRSLKLQ